MSTIYRRLGEVALPTDGDSVVAGVFQDIARDNMLALFKAAINAELAGEWATALAGTPMADTLPVQSALPMEPTLDIVQQFKQKLPLLALHRTGTAEYSERTLTLEQRTQQWQMHYIMAPLRADHAHKVTAALTYVTSVVQATIQQQGHPAYQDGAVQFGDGLGRLSTLRLVSHESGVATFAQDDNDARYLACSMILESTEIGRYLETDWDDFDGATISLDVGQEDGFIDDLVVGETEHTPPYA